MKKEKVIILRIHEKFKEKVKIRAKELELDMSKYLIQLIKEDLKNGN